MIEAVSKKSHNETKKSMPGSGDRRDSREISKRYESLIMILKYKSFERRKRMNPIDFDISLGPQAEGKTNFDSTSSYKTA